MFKKTLQDMQNKGNDVKIRVKRILLFAIDAKTFLRNITRRFGNHC